MTLATAAKTDQDSAHIPATVPRRRNTFLSCLSEREILGQERGGFGGK